MLFPQALHGHLADGTITVAFRRWRRPTVRAGGTLRYPLGVLAIDEVARISPEEVSRADARAAGADGPEELLDRLGATGEGELYRIRFHHLGDDPREQRQHDADPDDLEVATIRERLERIDARSRRGAWTFPTLRLLARRPGVAAGELAAELGIDRDVLKRDVRKLKELGLTVSLSVGYELSPEGGRSSNGRMRDGRARTRGAPSSRGEARGRPLVARWREAAISRHRATPPEEAGDASARR